MRTAIRLALATAGATLLLAAPASAGMLDQQYDTNEGGWASAYTDNCVAQTFTAGVTGAMDQVDLKLKSGNAPLTVQIQTASTTAPGGTVLASASIPPSAALPDEFTFVPVALPSPPAVVARSQYAIVIYSGGALAWSWEVGGFDPASASYPGGQEFEVSGPNMCPPSATASWDGSQNLDAAFRTYVIPATGIRAAALKKCKKKAHKHHWSHKKLKKCKKKARLLPV
jgi:hypothetical protein